MRTELVSVRHRGRALAVVLLSCAAVQALAEPTGVPSFQVDYPYPTADKPQSKLWFDGRSWFALLPRSTGPSLWERTENGWEEHASIAEALRGWPGRADVWFDTDGATAAGAADRQIGVVRLVRSAAGWTARGLARLASPESDAIETVTLARDGRGMWWIAAAVQGKVFAWHSRDASAWSSPEVLGGGLHADDISVVTGIPGGIAVIWSNQKDDAILMRARRDEDSSPEWGAVHVIAQGGGTADDHLNTALAPDGTLFVASKNSVDTHGSPQLVLRIRSPDEQWRNLPYAPLLDDFSPSRPIVVATPDPALVLLGHSMYAREDRRLDHIVFGRFAGGSTKVLPAAVPVIEPDINLAARVNDVTGPKAAFPVGMPWIVLASDRDGRVFESDLRLLE